MTLCRCRRWNIGISRNFRKIQLSPSLQPWICWLGWERGMIPARKGEEEEDEERMERKDLSVTAPWQFEFPGMLSSRWDLGIVELLVPRAQTGNNLSSVFIQTFSLHAFRIPFFFPFPIPPPSAPSLPSPLLHFPSLWSIPLISAAN